MEFGVGKFNFVNGSEPVSIVEIGVNHNGDIKLAEELIDTAKACGGHIVKLQAFVASEEISRHAEKAEYQKETTGDEQSQLDLVKGLELSNNQLRHLHRYCNDMQMPFLCTAFESVSLDFLLRDLAVKSIKIASSEITNHPFLAEIAETGVGMILSTGASTLEEVAAAVRVIQDVSDNELVLLHCVSEYPAKMDELNLRAMETIRQAFNLPVGFSDHSQGIYAPIVASALGACAVEKHFTLDRNMKGPDHRASIEPQELKQMVLGMKAAHLSLGDGVKKPVPCEMPQIPIIRKSIVARTSLPKGHKIKLQDIAFKRPCNGIEPFDVDKIIGRLLKQAIEEDEPITWDVV